MWGSFFLRSVTMASGRRDDMTSAGSPDLAKF